MLQPTQYDAVLGGQQANLSTAAVLGGKGSIKRAIEALNNPEQYEQAKQTLLAQSKTTHSSLDIKFRSAKDASKWLRSVIKLIKIPRHYNYYKELETFTRPQLHLFFSTPAIERIMFVYYEDPNDLAQEAYWKWYLGNFPRTVWADWLESSSVSFKDVVKACQELPQAFNFTYFDGRDGLISDHVRTTTSISHYWDSTNQQMILLP